MQNKGFVTVFAVLLSLVCLFYLSFTLVTNNIYKKAKVYAAGDTTKESQYIDSLSTEKVWLGYTLKKSRTMELNLGLDLKGGMSVIMEIGVADALKSLSNDNTDPIFNQALAIATERQAKGEKDYISLFAEEYHKLDPDARLSAIFSTFELKEKITPQSSDAAVIAVLRKELNSAIDNSFNVLRTRIDRFGVVAPNIQKMEDGRISIELPGIKEKERVRTLLQGSANLEFWETFEEKEIHQALLAANTIVRDSIAKAQNNAPEEAISLDADKEVKAETTAAVATTEAETVPEAAADSSLLLEGETEETKEDIDNSAEVYLKNFPLFALLNLDPQQPVANGSIVGTVHRRSMDLVDQYLNMRQVKEALPRQLKLVWGVKAIDAKEEFFQLFALKITTRDGKAALEGDVVTDASDDFGQNSQYAEVNMTMNSDGAKKWARLTKENIGKSVAIVLDNHVYSAPTVNSEIPNGRSNITGHFTPEEAKDLANVLKSGKMSAPAHIIQEDVVGPSLGQESINKGFISFLFALVVLMGYLIFMYGWKPGLIADGALLLNLFFTLGFLASFHAVLTLSGIAGVVLALAMAVDANVLIYERIKEELRGGKTLKNAVAEGYDKAFSAIFDSNLTSLLTGIILFIFGTGPIRGFATTLIIGILISFFTAVFLTHAVYSYFMDKGKLLDLKFTTKLTENFLINMHFDFFKNKKLVYGINIAIVLICLLALGLRGLNQGIDFTGGRNYVVRFEQPVNTVEAQEMLDPFFEENSPSVITIGTSNQVRVSTNYKIADNSEGVEKEITQKLYDGFKPLLEAGTTYDQFANEYIQSSQKVGPSIAEDIKTGAFWAVIFSVFGIGLYILMRFKDISYSVGSIAALTADTIFILGMYAICWGFLPFSMEADQTFIGAVLTAIGYSINDKVVIFDRVREYTHLYPKRSKYELFNEALNSTLDRTFNTGMCTFIVLIIIFIFAGETVRSFSFAMLLGLIIGTISSLFTGAPIAYEMQNRKQLKLAGKEKAKK
ncbi:protein translocase subunit SecDF [Bacteroidia bacterium]|nr:protein translocase subunit SecDF [Bacteroidia bacterium]GHT85797.1 protein translocase subunit SecDF [Bacteroidia bacterium]GHV71390.1 protein translocase subunit SecDF [Bacteroidia bacterium]